MNETLKGLLMKMADSTSEWDQRLPYALFYYNCSPHSTTSESPYFALHGTDPTFVQFGTPSTVVSPYTVDNDSYKMNFARGMNQLHELISERIKREAKAMKALYDKKHCVSKTDFKVGDRVFVYNPNIPVDKHSTKLTPEWEGPFRVTEHSENSATVRYLGPRKLEKQVQLDFIRKIPSEVCENMFYLYEDEKLKQQASGQRKKRGRPKKTVLNH